MYLPVMEDIFEEIILAYASIWKWIVVLARLPLNTVYLNSKYRALNASGVYGLVVVRTCIVKLV